jgi:DNA-binding NarL/FixJ family response regulator
MSSMLPYVNRSQSSRTDFEIRSPSFNALCSCGRRMEQAENTRNPITLLIAVAVRLYRDGLAAVLQAQPHLRVVGTAATPLDAQAAGRNLAPHVVIVDVLMDGALDLMRAVRAESPGSRILAFAAREEIEAILDYAQAGADGFVTANGSIPELVEAVERTAAGELLCSPRMAAQLLRRAAYEASRSGDSAEHNLTGRELQVFSLLKQGRTNKEIAVGLNIAEATVKNHVHHLLEKLHVSTRGQAIASASLPVKSYGEPAGHASSRELIASRTQQ